VTGLTGRDNWLEDFVEGDVIEHARGRTVTEMDNVVLTTMVMNTAQSHFNEDAMSETPLGRRLVFGGVTAALVLGLSSQDTCENAVAELGCDRIRFPTPVFHGDTLYAFTEVLEIRDAGQADAGEVRFRHIGLNQNRKVVFEGERRVLIKRRNHRQDR
jgi:acyl dehydratase